MITGVGGGKSWFLARVATMLAYENPPATLGLVCAPTYVMLTDVDMRACEDFWHEAEVPFAKKTSDRSYYLRETGNEIAFRQVDQPDRIRGLNAAWVVADEISEWDEYAFNVVMGRLRDPRSKHQVFFGVGTPKGFNWVYERFVEPDGKKRLPFADVIHGTSLDNFTLSEDFFRGMEASYDPELYAQEVLGKFTAMGGGRTYHQFDRDLHLKAFDLDPALPIRLCVDFNVDPMCWVVAQGSFSPGQPFRAIDEIRIRGASTQAACREFLDRYGDHAMGWEVYGDATGDARKTTGQSDFEVIRDLLKVSPRVWRRGANPPVIDRVNAVNAALKTADGKIHFFVHPTKCPELLKDMEQMRNIEGTREPDKSDVKRSHASDAVGYAVHMLRPIIAGRRAA